MSQPTPGSTAPPKAKPVVPGPPGVEVEDPSEIDMIDESVLQDAIDAVETVDDDQGAAAIRKLIMEDATDLGLVDLVPPDWNTDGTVGDTGAPNPDTAPPRRGGGVLIGRSGGSSNPGQ